MAKKRGKKRKLQEALDEIAREREQELESQDVDEFEDEEQTEELALATSLKNDVMYLNGNQQGPPVIIALVPPDMEKCQCEWPDNSVVSFGPKPTVRCDQESTVVAFQKRDPNEDAPTGAISLCDELRIMIEHMYPGQCYFRRITPEKKIGDIA